MNDADESEERKQITEENAIDEDDESKRIDTQKSQLKNEVSRNGTQIEARSNSKMNKSDITGNTSLPNNYMVESTS